MTPDQQLSVFQQRWSLTTTLSLGGTLFLITALQVQEVFFLPALLSYFLCVQFRVRGFLASLLLLTLLGMLVYRQEKLLVLQLLGLESSLLLSCAIATLSFDEIRRELQGFGAEKDALQEAKGTLQERLKESEKQLDCVQEALEEQKRTLQEELNQMQEEHSSFLVLNDVLRKTSAQEMMQREHLQERLVQEESLHLQTLQELERERENSKGLSSQELAVQNRHLLDETNQVRREMHQTRSINETLVRMHAKESQKVETLLQEKWQSDQTQQQLQTELSVYTERFEALRVEQEQQRWALEELKRVQTERNFLQERVKQAELSVEQLKQKPSAVVVEGLDVVQKKLKDKEIALKQLRAQFEEKKLCLEDTRKQLFHKDAALSALQIEQESRAFQEKIPQEIWQQIEEMDRELQGLEKENRQLEKLVTLFMPDPPQSAKKNPSSSQPLLF